MGGEDVVMELVKELLKRADFPKKIDPTELKKEFDRIHKQSKKEEERERKAAEEAAKIVKPVHQPEFEELEKVLRSPDDVQKLRELKNALSRIEKLEAGVKNFKGVHFNLQYKILQEDATKEGMGLDAIPLNDTPKLKDLRKRLLIYINNCTKNLNSKVHSDGRYCQDCEH